MNSYLVLRALAAREMPHERELSCRRAAGKPAIHADCNEDIPLKHKFLHRRNIAAKADAYLVLIHWHSLVRASNQNED